MPLPKLEPSARVGDQVFEAVHSAIMSGELPAGHRLRIRELADELGTSVMPVREAIRRLEQVGLAEAEPYRGAVVKQLSPTELLHIYTVRRLLEEEATALGAGRLSEQDETQLHSLLGAMKADLAKGRTVDYLEHDEQLLGHVYEASGNPVLVDNIRTLWRRCRPYKIVGAQGEIESGDATQLVAHQEQLLDAVRERDTQRAARITTESLDAAIARIREALPH